MSSADADGGAELYSREECDGVIALGGGSVIDASKCIALLAANPGSIADYAGKPDAPHHGGRTDRRHSHDCRNGQ